MILIQGGAGQYRLSKTCAVHGTQPFLPPYSDFFELIMEALLRIKTQLISHPWKLTYLSVLLTDSPEHPFLFLSGCYKLSAFTGRLSKCCLENISLFPYSVPPVCSDISGCCTGEASSRTSLHYAQYSSNLASLNRDHPRQPHLFQKWLTFPTNFLSGFASKVFRILWSADKHATGQSLT